VDWDSTIPLTILAAIDREKQNEDGILKVFQKCCLRDFLVVDWVLTISLVILTAMCQDKLYVDGIAIAAHWGKLIAVGNSEVPQQ
jgi:hypothetical protein